jgi:hypothetical protein
MDLGLLGGELPGALSGPGAVLQERGQAAGSVRRGWPATGAGRGLLRGAARHAAQRRPCTGHRGICGTAAEVHALAKGSAVIARCAALRCASAGGPRAHAEPASTAPPCSGTTGSWGGSRQGCTPGAGAGLAAGAAAARPAAEPAPEDAASCRRARRRVRGLGRRLELVQLTRRPGLCRVGRPACSHIGARTRPGRQRVRVRGPAAAAAARWVHQAADPPACLPAGRPAAAHRHPQHAAVARLPWIRAEQGSEQS